MKKLFSVSLLLVFLAIPSFAQNNVRCGVSNNTKRDVVGLSEGSWKIVRGSIEIKVDIDILQKTFVVKRANAFAEWPKGAPGILTTKNAMSVLVVLDYNNCYGEFGPKYEIKIDGDLYDFEADIEAITAWVVSQAVAVKPRDK